MLQSYAKVLHLKAIVRLLDIDLIQRQVVSVTWLRMHAALHCHCASVRVSELLSLSMSLSMSISKIKKQTKSD